MPVDEPASAGSLRSDEHPIKQIAKANTNEKILIDSSLKKLSNSSQVLSNYVGNPQRKAIID